MALLYKSNIGFTQIIFFLIFSPVALALGPLFEEVFHKGMLFITTSRKVGLLVGAIFVSFLQTLVHFTYNIPELQFIFIIIGLLGCYIFVWTRKIIAPLLLHSTLNFVVLMRDINVSLG